MDDFKVFVCSGKDDPETSYWCGPDQGRPGLCSFASASMLCSSLSYGRQLDDFAQFFGDAGRKLLRINNEFGLFARIKNGIRQGQRRVRHILASDIEQPGNGGLIGEQKGGLLFFHHLFLQAGDFVAGFLARYI